MISKFLSKLKSILFKSPATPETSLKKEKKQQNLQKQKQKQKQKQRQKPKR